MAEKKPPRLCPVCQKPLILQFTKDDPHIRQSPVTMRYIIPMRCSGCGINLEISVDQKELEEDPDDLE
jgi:hypothetical protein